ncbi:MAG TPA: DEAD/DEAH box helicase [Bdellovibrionales bacterium]|nr:DEAD/DEAH box helicase [Bdellovibrionales bacterium]
MNDEFFKTIQELCSRELWSRAVELTRSADLIHDKNTPDEIVVRIVSRTRPVSPRVILWPGDEDWKCDCKDEDDPCVHVAAAAIASRHGKVKAATEETKSAAGQVQYHFSDNQGVLTFERRLVWSGSETPLLGTLMNYVSGVTSGRISGKPVSATKEDFHIDTILGDKRAGTLEQRTLANLLPALAELPAVFLDGKPVKASPTPVDIFVEIVDENGGFRVRKSEETGFEKIFGNGAALKNGELRPVPLLALEPELAQLLKGEGTWFTQFDRFRLIETLIPTLKRRLKVVTRTSRLPELINAEPEIIIKIEKHGPDLMVVTPLLVYGDPPIAYVQNDKLEPVEESKLPIRKKEAEQKLARRLAQELYMKPGNPVRFFGAESLAFNQKLQKWKVAGTAQKDFVVQGKLEAKAQVDGDKIDVSFVVPGGPSGGKDGKVSSLKVLENWNAGVRHIHVEGFGWWELPDDWLARFGERLNQLLSVQKEAVLPQIKNIEQLSFLEEIDAEIPPDLKSLKALIDGDPALKPAPLPKDLQIELRSYQREGVNWLYRLTRNGLGALLADDMGLGKTLQSLCVIEGKTLIVCPTSVLQSWSEQIRAYRPSLDVTVYHGPKRSLDSIERRPHTKTSVMLTSYGIFRAEIETLRKMHWQTIVVDEAQHFKNQDSQLSRALYQITAPIRITLSGTPIENSIDDIWAQFRFLNPGLLPPYSRFREEFTDLVELGETPAALRLRKKIRPFILRRMKQDVAKELPPKTEMTLTFELNEPERELYEALRISAQKEVAETINEGGSLFSALELLLRLRQACCHQSLVPGQRADGSTKTEVLLERLEESIANGHKSLVFSQWTSYLDLIEPELEKRRINYVRLDGSTRDRESVVKAFQRENGPPVFLISLKAGGVGLTLTQADHVFILDPWWNPAVEQQAADRAHRIGQTKSVFVYRLVAKDTVEERVLRLQERKKHQMQLMLEGTETTTWSKADLLEILS